MKKTFLCFSALLIFAVPGFGDGFHSVHSPNGLDVWAVGNGGVVFHSIDGGATWTTFTLGSATLRSAFTYGSNVWIVGDSGKCHISTDGGNTWSIQTLGGGGTLRSITFGSPLTGWIAGNSGLILKTSDGGLSWAPQSLGPGPDLYAIAFVDSQVGYAAGAGATLLKTSDGGVTWSDIAPAGWSKDILSISASGLTVYASGTDESCYRSSDGGMNWSELNFKTDTHSDVNAVFAVSPTNVCFVGGGGFIRTSANGGSSFNYGMHQMHAKLNSVFFYGSTHAWACSDRNNAVLRTTDGGATWQLPQGTTVNYQWQQKFNANSIGNTFCVNPTNKNYIYVVTASGVIRMSPDRGETWSQTATISTGGSTWSFYVSPKDTNIWVAATSGGGKGVRRSTNRGLTWTTTLLRNFTNYGMPLEMDPDHPDTLIFAAEGTGSGPDGILYISTNFGATWDTLAQTSFRSPCDIVILPGNTNVWYVGDGVTGLDQAQMWRSANYGKNWTSIYTSPSSEIPMIAVSRLRNTNAFATAWSSLNFRKTTNSGLSWQNAATTSSTWGTDIAKDDPNVVVYGTYGGSTSYLSTDGGSSFNSVSLTGSNSGMLAYDRATFLAHQAGNGVWKYNITYNVPVTNLQTIAVVEPAPGSVWQYNTSHDITWNSGNVANVRIHYKTSPASPWQQIVASTPASTGTYAWTIPDAPSTQARVRIADAADGIPVDSSGLFTISVASISSVPGSLSFGLVAPGSTTADTVRIHNTGTATLVVSSATLVDSGFAVGRTSFSIPPGSSDTLSVVFAPNATGVYRDTLRLANNTPDPVLSIPLSGTGTVATSLSVLVPNGGEVWQYNETHNITWSGTGVAAVRLEYRTQPSAAWQAIADSVAADSGSFAWTIPNAPTGQARVKISDVATGTVVDSSDNVFSIVSASVVVSPTSLDFGDVPILQVAADTLRIENPGTAPLVISQIASDSAAFSPSRTSVTIPPGNSDTISVLFAPTQMRSYSATLRLTSNAPASPTSVPLSGMGTNPVSAGSGNALPTAYTLHQNYPNPFNPMTSIGFEVPRESHVTLKLYNALGQELAILVDRSYVPGIHVIRFDASRLPSGMYIYRMNAADLSGGGKNFVETRRMMLVK